MDMFLTMAAVCTGMDKMLKTVISMPGHKLAVCSLQKH